MSGTALSVTGFVLLGLAAAALQVRALQDRARRGWAGGEAPTAPRALAAAMRTAPGRFLVLTCWLWVGVHFLAR
jgi:Family of unknown function (DUF6186)